MKKIYVVLNKIKFPNIAKRGQKAKLNKIFWNNNPSKISFTEKSKEKNQEKIVSPHVEKTQEKVVEKNEEKSLAQIVVNSVDQIVEISEQNSENKCIEIEESITDLSSQSLSSLDRKFSIQESFEIVTLNKSTILENIIHSSELSCNIRKLESMTLVKKPIRSTKNTARGELTCKKLDELILKTQKTLKHIPKNFMIPPENQAILNLTSAMPQTEPILNVRFNSNHTQRSTITNVVSPTPNILLKHHIKTNPVASIIIDKTTSSLPVNHNAIPSTSNMLEKSVSNLQRNISTPIVQTVKVIPTINLTNEVSSTKTLDHLSSMTILPPTKLTPNPIKILSPFELNSKIAPAVLSNPVNNLVNSPFLPFSPSTSQVSLPIPQTTQHGNKLPTKFSVQHSSNPPRRLLSISVSVKNQTLRFLLQDSKTKQFVDLKSLTSQEKEDIKSCLTSDNINWSSFLLACKSNHVESDTIQFMFEIFGPNMPECNQNNLNKL